MTREFRATDLENFWYFSSHEISTKYYIAPISFAHLVRCACSNPSKSVPANATILLHIAGLERRMQQRARLPSSSSLRRRSPSGLTIIVDTAL